MSMSNGAEWLIGVFILGIFIGILVSNNISSLAVEVTPNNSLKAAIAFNKPALPR
jgi:hypothetical protein